MVYDCEYLYVMVKRKGTHAETFISDFENVFLIGYAGNIIPVFYYCLQIMAKFRICLLFQMFA